MPCDDTILLVSFRAVVREKVTCAKSVTAAFDGGRLTSDGGVMLLGVSERRMGIADRLAGLITD